MRAMAFMDRVENINCRLRQLHICLLRGKRHVLTGLQAATRRCLQPICNQFSIAVVCALRMAFMMKFIHHKGRNVGLSYRACLVAARRRQIRENKPINYTENGYEHLYSPDNW